ncbi:DUF1801 domain-containing protein [uncultured Flavobacterium sp.]|uniref:DUF1801 domain-containing protein n=1 Tax=uncultured Flavobacterium sp. TaxID=165435 RepID=UPI0025E3BB55|nr:DUF1801 domain-containing protein [uncultured Flavobacterium sp.]
MRPIDSYFLEKEGNVRECLLSLRSHILSYTINVTEEWKYRMPFYCYKGKMLCYFWTDKKIGYPYIGFVDGGKMDYPELIQDKRARMKILPVDPEAELPIALVNTILDHAMRLRN